MEVAFHQILLIGLLEVHMYEPSAKVWYLFDFYSHYSKIAPKIG